MAAGLRGRPAQRVGELRGALEPVGGVRGDRLRDDELDVLRDRAVPRAERHDRITGQLAREHLVEHEPERVDIASRVRRHAARPAVRGSDSGESGVSAAGAEPGQDRHAVAAREQDVLRADVAVDDAPGVRCGERAGDIGRDPERLRDGELALAVQPVAQGLAGHVRDGVVDRPRAVAEIHFSGVEQGQDRGSARPGRPP